MFQHYNCEPDDFIAAPISVNSSAVPNGIISNWQGLPVTLPDQRFLEIINEIRFKLHSEKLSHLLASQHRLSRVMLFVTYINYSLFQDGILTNRNDWHTVISECSGDPRSGHHVSTLILDCNIFNETIYWELNWWTLTRRVEGQWSGVYIETWVHVNVSLARV